MLQGGIWGGGGDELTHQKIKSSSSFSFFGPRAEPTSARWLSDHKHRKGRVPSTHFFVASFLDDNPKEERGRGQNPELTPFQGQLRNKKNPHFPSKQQRWPYHLRFVGVLVIVLLLLLLLRWWLYVVANILYIYIYYYYQTLYILYIVRTIIITISILFIRIYYIIYCIIIYITYYIIICTTPSKTL